MPLLSFMSSLPSPSQPPPPPNEEENGTTPQRKRIREEETPSTPNRFELMVVEEEEPLPVVEHLAALPLLLDQGSVCRLKTGSSYDDGVSRRPGKYTIVVGVNGDVRSLSLDVDLREDEDPSFKQQFYTCRALGVCPHRIYHSLLRGHFPNDMIVYNRPVDGMDMLLWYATSKAVDRMTTLVVIDVTDWQIIPGFFMRDCRCVMEEETNRCARQSLRFLSNMMEENSNKFCEQDYIQACGHMKRIFKSLSA